MKTTVCPLCEGEIQRDDLPASSCMAVRAVPAPECWLQSGNRLLVLCAQSRTFRRFREDLLHRRNALLHDLGPAVVAGDTAVRAYLAQLSPEDRFDLLRSVVPELAAYLATLAPSITGFDARPTPRKVVIPDELPPGLATSLQAYHDKLQARYTRLLAKGHARAPNYVWRIMVTQIRFAEHLHARGIERWDVVRNRDIVAFLADNPQVHKSKVMRFMKFLNEHRPFRETRGRGKRSQGGERRNILPPKIVSADVLDALLKDIRATCSDAEYLLAWLVCRLGLMARPAYDLTLDRVRINDNGRLVIRPAQVWLSVPRPIEALFRSAIDGAVPNWTQRSPQQLKKLTFFRHYIPNLDLFTMRVLQKRSRILRASAVFAQMMKGQVDRITLHETIGVSMPFLVKLELLLSTDMHRSLDPNLVKQRNAYIRGERDA